MLRTIPPLFLSVLLQAQAPEVPSKSAAPQEKPPAAMQSIVKKDLLEFATWMADDARGGRLTGSAGQEETAKWIAAHFENLGLEPLGDEADGKRTFFQRYGISRTTVVDTTKLRCGKVELREGFAILGGRPTDVKIDGMLRYCGLGRTRGDSADVKADDTLDNEIAVVVLKPLRGRVGKKMTIEQKFGAALGTFGQLGRTTTALAKKGAKAVLFLQIADPAGLTDVLNYLALSPGKDSLVARFEGADPGMGAVSGMFGDAGGVPSLVLSLGASKSVLAELGVDADGLAEHLGGEGDAPKAKRGVPALLQLAVRLDDQATACNVVAVLRGSDPKLAAEAVVYSAHMDHVGRRMDGEVFNGADDNASGSAGLMAIAAAFAKSKEKPRRSLIFLSVSGEELGLWGSHWFADHPTWDAEAIVADVNTDMIGRSGPESAEMEVTVTPSNRHAAFSTIVRDAAGFAEQLGMTFTSGDKYYTRSDHYNFAKKGIPVVFFCSGEHEDYHQVTDHADKLDGDKMERVARLAFWTGWSVANADERPRTLGKREDWR